jgi:hypothetical protein
MKVSLVIFKPETEAYMPDLCTRGGCTILLARTAGQIIVLTLRQTTDVILPPVGSTAAISFRRLFPQATAAFLEPKSRERERERDRERKRDRETKRERPRERETPRESTRVREK